MEWCQRPDTIPEAQAQDFASIGMKRYANVNGWTLAVTSLRRLRLESSRPPRIYDVRRDLTVSAGSFADTWAALIAVFGSERNWSISSVEQRERLHRYATGWARSEIVDGLWCRYVFGLSPTHAIAAHMSEVQCSGIGRR